VMLMRATAKRFSSTESIMHGHKGRIAGLGRGSSGWFALLTYSCLTGVKASAL
jgi:hypothetical protein